jgi:hypothetical protein
METKRKTEVLGETGWVEIEFRDLKAGDTFRLFEPTGEIVIDHTGKNEFYAVTNAEIDPIHNEYSIRIDGEDPDLESGKEDLEDESTS